MSATCLSKIRACQSFYLVNPEHFICLLVGSALVDSYSTGFLVSLLIILKKMKLIASTRHIVDGCLVDVFPSVALKMSSRRFRDKYTADGKKDPSRHYNTS
jgi:hypothetical protein